MDQDPADARGAARSTPAAGLRRGVYARNVLLVLLLLVMLWLAVNVRLPSVDELQGRLEGLGGVAWIAFAGLYALVAMTPIPVTIMAITGGLLFGVVEGALLSVVGVLLGSWGAYWLARALGRSTVRRLLGVHAATVERHLEDAGFAGLCVLRLMPGVPYWPVNYGAGAFGVPQRTFLVAGLVSTLPGQVSLVSVGAVIADPTVAHGAWAACSWALVIVMTVWAWRSWKGTSSRSLPGERRRSG
ncbi:TVP38/TMEM64 family protein [Nesterenkonia sp. F]|uniref:TVP38/TMEM64 family protein n=1 Tax=Nesterenkonia sp. F TaxID=795955 RepID=UPI000255D774|nr:VTT domain-containing protein [Nesterenkonia sp. F]